MHQSPDGAYLQKNMRTSHDYNYCLYLLVSCSIKLRFIYTSIFKFYLTLTLNMTFKYWATLCLPQRHALLITKARNPISTTIQAGSALPEFRTGITRQLSRYSSCQREFQTTIFRPMLQPCCHLRISKAHIGWNCLHTSTDCFHTHLPGRQWRVRKAASQVYTPDCGWIQFQTIGRIELPWWTCWTKIALNINPGQHLAGNHFLLQFRAKSITYASTFEVQGDIRYHTTK